MNPGGPSEGPVFDRLGAWLSGRRLRRYAPAVAGKRVGVLGCGYQATWARGVLDQVQSAVLVEVAVADDLRRHPRVQAIEGRLPDVLSALPGGCLDLAVLASGLEDLAEPQPLLSQVHRLLAAGGVALISVCSRRAQRPLELAAFRLRLTPAARLTDQRRYYDVDDLGPLLVRAGFRAERIRCFSQVLGLITFAVCQAD